MDLYFGQNSLRRIDKDQKQINLNHRGSKRKYQSSKEEEPDTKKSRQSLTSDIDDYKKKHIQAKSEPESDSQTSDSHSESDSHSDESESSEEDWKQVKIKSTHVTKHSNEPSEHMGSKISKQSSESKHGSDKSSKSTHSSKEEISKDGKHSSNKKHSSDKNHKTDKQRFKEQEESKSSSQHSSDKMKTLQKDKSSTDKHNSQERKNSYKHSKTDKQKDKISSEKEEYDKQKPKDTTTSISTRSSKDRSSSNKEKIKDRSSSSKDKTKSNKNEKKQSLSNEKSDTSKSYRSASFAEAMGMVVPAKSKKKPTTPLKDAFSPKNIANDVSPLSLLAPDARLAPLPALEVSALPEISRNYKPRPPPKFMPHFTEEELGVAISRKIPRTKVYSGKKILGKIPSLYDMCVQVLQEHIDALEYTGGVPYEILKPVVDKATPQQLFMLEHYNPYLMEDTDHLWKKHCEKHFRIKKREEMETSREIFMKNQKEEKSKLRSLTAKIKLTQEAKKAPIKQTKMVYVDTVVKPPRNIARKQAVHGTAHMATASPAARVAATASPAARVAALAAAPNVMRGVVRAHAAPAHAAHVHARDKPKKAPLMAKVLQLMRGRKR